MEDDELQLVTVNGKYGYAWQPTIKRFDPETARSETVYLFLKISDVVLLPGARGRKEWFGRVTDLGSTWDKEFKRVIRPATTRETLQYVRDDLERRKKSAAKKKKE